MSNTKTQPEFVMFRMGGRVVRAEYFPGETLLDTARRAGVPIDTSCELGDCGTCMVELCTGKVVMANNNALTPQDLDEGQVLACQSVPYGVRCEVQVI